MSKPHFMVMECSLWEPQGEHVWEGPGAAPSDLPGRRPWLGRRCLGGGVWRLQRLDPASHVRPTPRQRGADPQPCRRHRCRVRGCPGVARAA